MALGSAYFRNGTLPDAEREYREALKIDSQVGEAHNNLAVVCLRRGDIKRPMSQSGCGSGASR